MEVVNDETMSLLCLVEPPQVGQAGDRPVVRPVPDVDLSFTAGQSAEVRENRSVEITFRTGDGNTLKDYEYDVQWTLPDGTVLTAGQSSGNVYVSNMTRYLTVNTSQLSNSGTYDLTLSNKEGSSSTSTNLQVFSTILTVVCCSM